jgi:hypothetical protein
MKLSRIGLLATVSFCMASVRAADATSPVDFTDRDTRFTPGSAVKKPEKQAPTTNATVQEKRVDKATLPKPTAPLADRQAPIDVVETREKNVREKQSKRPETLETPTSGYNHRSAGISPTGDTVKPPTVSKYQDSLAAASATNMARFPALDRATSAKINRFVFRKNPAESSAVTNGSPVIPAAGGSAVQK